MMNMMLRSAKRQPVTLERNVIFCKRNILQLIILKRHHYTSKMYIVTEIIAIPINHHHHHPPNLFSHIPSPHNLLPHLNPPPSHHQVFIGNDTGFSKIIRRQCTRGIIKEKILSFYLDLNKNCHYHNYSYQLLHCEQLF